jgi:Trpc4-associated protein
MERKRERSINSIFICLKKSKEFEKQILSPKNIINNIDTKNIELFKIEEYINYLRNSISKPDKNINKILSELTSFLEEGNNSNNIYKSFYSSKIFIDCFDLLQLSHPDYIEKIFELLKKIVKIKHISKYLAKNYDVINKLLLYLKDPNKRIVESAIKIIEILLMNELIPIDNIYDSLLDVYNYFVKTDKLDFFCRIVNILIFNYNKIEYKQMFKNRLISQTRPLVKAVTKNQIICINFEQFFEKLIKKLKSTLNITKKIILDEHSLLNYWNLILSDTGLSFIGDMNDPNFNISYQIINNNLDTSNTSLSKTELKKLLLLSVYKTLKLDINKLPINTNNIFNIYREIINNLKLLEDKNKIKKNNKQYQALFKYTSCQIEILFVLSTFLNCKRKVDVQNKLSNLKIIEILDSYFEYIEWGNIFSEEQRPYLNEGDIDIQDDTAYHGNGCNCDCDSALKIQYLRLIYNFCCRDDENIENRLKLFSQKDLQLFFDAGYMDLIKIILHEKYIFYKDNKNIVFNKDFISLIKKLKLDNGKEIQKIKTSYKDIETLIINLSSPQNLKNLVQVYNKDHDQLGLYIKLIFKYMQECYFSSARFWISSCIEIMLRGNNPFFQTFTLYSGLLYCLINDILYGKQDKNQTLQISFDILGELIKFNRCCFFVLDYSFNDNGEFNEFSKKIFSDETLIDSNVFLRAIILSIYFFDSNDKKANLSKEEFFSENSKICKYIKGKIYDLFLKLITIIKLEQITQTNISCINTALIILIVHYLEDNNLAGFLKSFRKIKGKEGLIGLDNFKSLLKMWKMFYNYKPKDSTSLFYSSNIDFNIWHQVSSLLLKEDINEPCSLYYQEKDNL